MNPLLSLVSYKLGLCSSYSICYHKIQTFFGSRWYLGHSFQIFSKRIANRGVRYRGALYLTCVKTFDSRASNLLRLYFSQGTTLPLGVDPLIYDSGMSPDSVD